MLGMGLTRFLPKEIRACLLIAAQMYRHGTTNIPFRPADRRLYDGRRVAIVGLFSIQCGLQRAAELMAISYETRGIAVLRFDLAGLLRLDLDRQASETKKLRTLRDFAPTDVIVHAPPPMFERFVAKWGKQAYSRSALIAYWHWELAAVPENWATAVQYCDEIWAPTPFVAEAITSVFQDAAAKVRVVPNPIEIAPYPHVSRPEKCSARKKFGFTEDDFICGFTFSMASGFERKNPLAAISSFQAAFPLTKCGQRLIIRCHDNQKYLAGWEIVVRAAAEDPRIVLSDGANLHMGIQEFYATIDVLLSLHRSEGYGLTIAEAAQSGIKVVTTSWGLAPELSAMEAVYPIDYKLVPVLDSQGLYTDHASQMWAEPNCVEASEKLQELFATVQEA